MKKILSTAFYFLLFTISLVAQTVTTTSEQTSDITFVISTQTTYDDGRIVTEQVPYNIDEFAALLVDQNMTNLIRNDRRSALITETNKEVNALEGYLTDSLGVNYDSLVAAKTLIALQGNWILTERINGVNTDIEVTISAHPTIPTALRMRDNTNSINYNLGMIHTQKFRVNNWTVGGGTEHIEMSLRQFANFTGYNGFSEDKSVRLILKRAPND